MADMYNIDDASARLAKLVGQGDVMEFDEDDEFDTSASVIAPNEQADLVKELKEREDLALQQMEGEPFITDTLSAGNKPASSGEEAAESTSAGQDGQDGSESSSADSDTALNASAASADSSKDASSVASSAAALKDEPSSAGENHMDNSQQAKSLPDEKGENEGTVNAASDVNRSDSSESGTSTPSEPPQGVTSHENETNGSKAVLSDSIEKHEDVSNGTVLKMNEQVKDGSQNVSSTSLPDEKKLDSGILKPEDNESHDEILTSPEIDAFLDSLAGHEKVLKSYNDSLPYLKGTAGYNNILESKKNEEAAIASDEEKIRLAKISLYEEKKKKELASLSSLLASYFQKLPPVSSLDAAENIESAHALAKSLADKVLALGQEADLKAETIHVSEGRFASVDSDGLKSLYLSRVPLYEDFLSKISNYEKELNDAGKALADKERRLSDAASLLEKMGYYPNKDINLHFLRVDNDIKELKASIDHLSKVVESLPKNIEVSGGQGGAVSMEEIRNSLQSISESLSDNVTNDVNHAMQELSSSVNKSSKEFADSVSDYVSTTLNGTVSDIFGKVEGPFNEKLVKFERSADAMVNSCQAMEQSSSAWSKYVHNVDKLSQNLDASTGMIPKQLDQLSANIFDSFQKQVNNVSNDAARQVTSAVRRELARSSSSIFPAPFNTPLAAFLIQIFLTVFLLLLGFKILF